jgi:phosphoglycerate dehydrogenase-like enzyme
MNQQDETERGIILWAAPPDLVPGELRERIREVGEGRELWLSMDRGEIEALADRVEIGFSDIPFDLVPRMPRLRWLQLWSAGADVLQQFPEFQALPFQMTTTSGIHRQQITEHIFALILAWNRNLKGMFANQTRHEWRRPGQDAFQVLAGKTMLILGYGTIGERAAQAALVFGMQVIGVRRSVRRHAGAEEEQALRVLPVSRLAEALPQADYVVNILPLTAETFHLFGEREFRAMKDRAIYVNVGRGATTDEAALVEALRSRRIGGALLDVTGAEPLPPDSPLWDLDNLLLSPHCAGFHPQYNELALEIALENLGRYVRGEPLRNLVDKAAGY